MTLPVPSTVAFAVVSESQVTLDGEVRTTSFWALNAVIVSWTVPLTGIDGFAGVTVRWSMLVPIVTVTLAVWLATMVAGADPTDCATPVPSALGYAVAVRVTCPAGRPLNVTGV